MADALYFDKGSHRKQQIYKWVSDTIFEFGQGNRLTEIKFLVVNAESQNDITNAINEFNSLIEDIINTEEVSGGVLGYILQKNIARFGKTRIILDLFKNLINVPRAKIQLVTKAEPKQLRTLKTSELRQKFKKKEKIRFGITPQNKRKKAELIVTFNKKTQTTILRLRDPKTKKFLKATESFKKELKSRK